MRLKELLGGEIMEILVRNGFVFDPLNNVNGEVLDIAIKNGKIVDSSEINISKAKIIDASGKTVMPGGVDIHSHIAGPKVNTGRLMRPEDHYVSFMKFIPGVRRSGTGKTTPSTGIIGYRYARMGWTTVIEPATPPLETRHTHEELDDIPIIDKACFPLLDTNWFVMKYVSEKDYGKCAAYVAWILEAIKGYAIKIVDPGCAELWSYGRGYNINIDDQIPPYNVTPREIVRTLCKVSKILNLPHTIHIHCNRLGIPGNYETTLETMKSVADIGDGVNMHVTHCQFNAYAGESWPTLESGSESIAKYVNKRGHVTLDIGQIIFGGATTMTADASFEFALYHMYRGKWSSKDVEAESASGIVPVKYKKKSLVNALQWCIGLELALLIENPWKVLLTTDHPNGGPFTRYPWVISWVMSRKAREEVLKNINKKAYRRAILPSIDREYSLYDVVVMTRAAPAKLAGLNSKGHLGVGADADVAIYNINPREINPSRDYDKIIKAFRHAYCTIKNGEIVVLNGEVVKTIYGKTFYVKVEGMDELKNKVKSEVMERFKEWYSVDVRSYEIADYELRNPYPVMVKASG
jgi:formylmethanofuran dehydrogenase subunit A